MNHTTVAALKILYEAVFPAATYFPQPDVAFVDIQMVRADAEDLLKYANAISTNDTGGAGYYQQLAAQLRNVMVERDLVRLAARHNASCTAIPNGKFVQKFGRGLRMKGGAV